MRRLVLTSIISLAAMAPSIVGAAPSATTILTVTSASVLYRTPVTFTAAVASGSSTVTSGQALRN